MRGDKDIAPYRILSVGFVGAATRRPLWAVRSGGGKPSPYGDVTVRGAGELRRGGALSPHAGCDKRCAGSAHPTKPPDPRTHACPFKPLLPILASLRNNNYLQPIAKAQKRSLPSRQAPFIRPRPLRPDRSPRCRSAPDESAKNWWKGKKMRVILNLDKASRNLQALLYTTIWRTLLWKRNQNSKHLFPGPVKLPKIYWGMRFR